MKKSFLHCTQTASANTNFDLFVRLENFSIFQRLHLIFCKLFHPGFGSFIHEWFFGEKNFSFSSLFSLCLLAYRIMKYLCVILPAILAVILSISSKRVTAQPVCSSAYLDNPQNRKLCATLANFFGFPNSLETYSDEIRPNFGYGLPLSYKGRLSPSDFIENMPGTKRQDVDHVFLRFGRRR